MADPDAKHSTNIEGKWYVDEGCIDCDLCYGSVPEVFKQQEEENHSFVFAQPDEEDEDLIQRCEEALEDCPVQAIGNDG